MTTISEPTLNRKPADDHRATAHELVDAVETRCTALVELARQAATLDEQGRPWALADFEPKLRDQLMALGRLIVTLFLTLAEQAVAAKLPWRVQRAETVFKRGKRAARSLDTTFGVVRYARHYMRRLEGPDGGGYHPFDEAIGLTGDRFSFNLLTMSVRLATRMPYQEARQTMGFFLEAPPSTEVIEKATLGLGRYTADFFEQAPPPSHDGADGEVLVVMFDSKGIPTATDSELQRRRGKRKPRTTQTPSRRHRGRDKRQSSPRKRRKPGDKSKNAKMATIVVMYTMRREGDQLVGPLNVFRYVSLAPKRHAFQIAVREAKKRGFVPDAEGRFGERDGKLVQVVFDGDPDLERYARELLPGALMTVDVMHVLGYVWTAALAVHRGGDAHDDQRAWFEVQKQRLYGAHLDDLLGELREHRAAVPRSGPNTAARRKALDSAIDYIEKRRQMLGYAVLLERDLEIASGAVEGAVKHVVGKRFDHGGMRWVRERAEALLQLRCIDINQQWEAFSAFVRGRLTTEATASGGIVRIQQDAPEELPAVVSMAA